MMKYSIPTNWQKDLIPGLCTTEGSELYGKLADDVVGGGRASAWLPQVSFHQAEEHVRAASRKGLRFNYLLNATCLSDIRHLQAQQNNIIKILDWLVSVRVDAVTVSSPYLFRLVRKHAPKLKISVSVQENIHYETQIRRWDELGVDRINLSVLDINRNFSLLKRMRAKARCELQLIANLECLVGCPSYHCHSNLQAHGSQSQHELKGFLIDYYTLRCRYTRLNNTAEFIKSLWIRPEDVHYYEKVGIQWLKFVGREMDSKKIHFILDAYHRRKLKGDLLELFSGTKKKLFNPKKMFLASKYFFRPQHINVFGLMKARHIFSDPGIYIDNSKLDGFLEYFWQGKCPGVCGRDCRYCEEVAERAIVIDEKKRKKFLKNVQAFLNELFSGGLFNC